MDTLTKNMIKFRGCKDCIRECPDRKENRGCKDKELYEDSKKFKAYDMMMKQNRGIEGPM